MIPYSSFRGSETAPLFIPAYLERRRVLCPLESLLSSQALALKGQSSSGKSKAGLTERSGAERNLKRRIKIPFFVNGSCDCTPEDYTPHQRVSCPRHKRTIMSILNEFLSLPASSQHRYRNKVPMTIYREVPGILCSREFCLPGECEAI